MLQQQLKLYESAGHSTASPRGGRTLAWRPTMAGNVLPHAKDCAYLVAAFGVPLIGDLLRHDDQRLVLA